VASRVGYNEIAYFSCWFRKEVGLSPRQYQTTEATAIEPAMTTAGLIITNAKQVTQRV
jgi:AraC-like DNA-binding protein